MGDGKSGVYGGFTIAPEGVGGGVYVDSHGNIYPQAYVGTPGFQSLEAIRAIHHRC